MKWLHQSHLLWNYYTRHLGEPPCLCVYPQYNSYRGYFSTTALYKEKKCWVNNNQLEVRVVMIVIDVCHQVGHRGNPHPPHTPPPLSAWSRPQGKAAPISQFTGPRCPRGTRGDAEWSTGSVLESACQHLIKLKWLRRPPHGKRKGSG